MRVLGAERMYAAGDAFYFSGPKMGHMVVRQAEVAAENVLAEIEGREPTAVYKHELTLGVVEGGVRTGRGHFWGWAKRAHEKYFQALHS